jgi:hypothetical protein
VSPIDIALSGAERETARLERQDVSVTLICLHAALGLRSAHQLGQCGYERAPAVLRALGSSELGGYWGLETEHQASRMFERRKEEGSQQVG